MRKLVLLAPLLLALALSSCGLSYITCQDPSADIYADGTYLGRGKASIRRTGVPRRTELEARKSGKVIGEITTKRYFELGTALGGLYTYGLGLVFFWKYPKEIYLPVDQPSGEGPARSIWELPPGSGKQ